MKQKVCFMLAALLLLALIAVATRQFVVTDASKEASTLNSEVTTSPSETIPVTAPSVTHPSAPLPTVPSILPPTVLPTIPSSVPPTVPPTEPWENVRMVTHDPQRILEQTYTGLPGLPCIPYYVTDPDNLRNLKTQRVNFSFGVASNGRPNQITVNNQAYFDRLGFDTLTWDNRTQGKVLYLTFDCGYEYKNLAAEILDTLDEKNVSAAFFCTLHYLHSSTKNVTRMILDGHIVGNHSATHPSDPSALSRETLAWEALGVHNYLRANYGYESRYFRFPAGVYSENALELISSVGYRSVFWSIAYADWDPANQPDKNVALDTLKSRLHPGAVILLHATSPVNAEILGEFIDYCRSEGYEFNSLDAYPNW